MFDEGTGRPTLLDFLGTSQFELTVMTLTFEIEEIHVGADTLQGGRIFFRVTYLLTFTAL